MRGIMKMWKKCENCHRNIWLEEGVIMVLCRCGEMIEREEIREIKETIISFDNNRKLSRIGRQIIINKIKPRTRNKR